MAAPKNAISFENILLDLKNKIYSPVFFLYGEEAYFIDVISDYIEQNVLTEIEKEFNQSIIYGKDIDIPTLISYARRFPMMSNYQVIIVKEAQNLDKIENLEPYILNPLETTILVLCYKYEKIDRRKTLFKNIEKKGILFESAKIYENKIPDWISAYVRKMNYSISPKACFLLSGISGK